MGPAGRTLRSARGTAGARALVTHSDVIYRPESRPRYPASRPAEPFRSLEGPAAPPLAGGDHYPAGTASRCRRHCVASPAGTARHPRAMAHAGRHHYSFHHRCRCARANLRRDALPRLRRRRRAAISGPPQRTSRRLPGRQPVADLPPRDGSADRAWNRRGRRAVLRPRARRVRRDDHVRRLLPRRDAHTPDRVVPRDELGPDTAIALALVLLAVSLGVLLALRDRWLPGTA